MENIGHVWLLQVYYSGKLVFSKLATGRMPSLSGTRLVHFNLWVSICCCKQII